MTPSRAVREYLTAIEEANPRNTALPTSVSLTDPVARFTAAPGGPAFYAYLTNYLVDVDAGIIVDVEATLAFRTDEVNATRTMIDRVEERFDLKPTKLIGDMDYGAAELLDWMVDEKAIEPHVPVRNKTQRKDETLSSSDFQWDEQNGYTLFYEEERPHLGGTDRPHPPCDHQEYFVPCHSLRRCVSAFWNGLWPLDRKATSADGQVIVFLTFDRIIESYYGYLVKDARSCKCMDKDPSKIKRCAECKRLADAATMRPISRLQFGGVRFVCPDCFIRVMALRTIVREAKSK